MSLQTNALPRRIVTVPAVCTTAVALTLTIPLWVPMTVAGDLLRGKRRCPTAGLLSFGVCWAWLETLGVFGAAALWLTGQRRNARLHDAHQRFWSNKMLASLGTTCGIIFPEGTRFNPAKRVSALQRIGDRDPDRAARLSTLRHLLPPRPSGARAMATAAPDADVVLGWHVGFEGLESFGGLLAALNRRISPIRISMRRVPSRDVPRDERFEGWLDDQWVRMDTEVSAALNVGNDRSA